MTSPGGSTGCGIGARGTDPMSPWRTTWTGRGRDGTGNLSRSDEIQAWDGPRGLQMLQLAVGPNASALGMQWGIRLEDGDRFLCLNAGSGVDLATLGAVVGMGGAGVAVLLGAVWRPGGRGAAA